MLIQRLFFSYADIEEGKAASLVKLEEKGMHSLVF